MIFIIGGSGRLGHAINRSYKADNPVSVERSIYQDWWRSGASDDVSRFFERWSGTNSTVFVTAGLLDPKRSEEDLLRVNYLLPKNIIKGSSKVGIRVVTFGTVMEHLFATNNPYIQSKAMLGGYISEAVTLNNMVLHIRLHTLYGRELPSSFMFLGQIYHALMTKSEFKMSPGKQLREYHHVDDDIMAVHALVSSEVKGVIDLSHGKPVSLKELALYIFTAFNSKKLLRIGALPEPEEENFNMVFDPPDLLKNIKFRVTLPSVTA